MEIVCVNLGLFQENYIGERVGWHFIKIILESDGFVATFDIIIQLGFFLKLYGWWVLEKVCLPTGPYIFFWNSPYDRKKLTIRYN